MPAQTGQPLPWARLEIMAFGTDPPDFAAAAGNDIFGCKGAIFGGVPFFGEDWQLGGKVVFAALHGSVGADGTACAVDAGFYLCAPLVAMCAAPPDDAMATGEHLVWCEVAVFLCVPFLSKEWIFCGEVVFSGDGKTSAAIWAACAAAGASVHGGLPSISVSNPIQVPLPPRWNIAGPAWTTGISRLTKLAPAR